MGSDEGGRSDQRQGSNQTAAFVVGDLRIDVGKQSVSRDNADIPLPNLSFKLLMALVHSAPNFVSNDELMTRVWSGTVVSPETVSKRAALLRESLGDDPRAPRYILGLRSRGYRIIAPVSSATNIAENEIDAAATRSPDPIIEGPPAEEPTASDMPARRRGRTLTGVLGVIAAAVFVGVIIVRLLPAQRAQTKPATEQSHTVAVLPFDNISANANDAYLALGIPEMLLNRLASVQDLVVIARGSSFAVDRKPLESPAIGARLNAAYLVEGSVQRDGERLRVSVELIDAASSKLLWSQRFDRRVQEILDVEDEIGNEVAGALTARFGGPSAKPVLKERSNNVEAYLAYLKGTTLLNRFTVAGSDAAVTEFARAIELDPHFAPAYASLYDARMQGASRRYEDLAPARKRYQYLIDRALTIDPKSGVAYFARAMWNDADAQNASREMDFKRGAQLAPSNGRGLTAYSEFLDDLARHDEAARVLNRALQVDPISPRAHYRAAMRSLETGGHDVLEQRMREVLELDPDYLPALQRYGKYRWEFHGDFTGGLQLMEHAIALDPKNPWTRHTAMAMYLDIGEVDAARDVAAGTEQSAVASRILFAQHHGDWRAAGLSAMEGEPGWSYGLFENWGAGEALRDYAIKVGDIDKAIAFLSKTYGIALGSAPRLDISNFRQAFYISQLLAARGRPAQAAELMHIVESWNDANEAKFGPLFARRLRASIFLQEGRRDAALTELAEAFHSNDYLQWWYTLDFDPTWLSLRGDPRFRAIAEEVRQYAEKQRAALQQLRRQGLVPQRSETSATR